MSHLDGATLLFVSAVVGLLFTTGALCVYVTSAGGRAPMYWALSGLLYAVGGALGVLYTLQQIELDSSVLVLLGNVSYQLSIAMLVVGICEQVGARSLLWHWLALALVAAVAYAVVPAVSESLAVRVLLHIPVVVVMLLWALLQLGEEGSAEAMRYRLPVSLLLGGYAAVLVVRIAVALMPEAPLLAVDPDTHQAVFLIAGIAFFGGLATALPLLLLSEKQIELEQLVRIDQLTGAYNRRALDDVAAAEISSSKREQRPLGFVLLDIDHFKRVNDTWGHAAGDAVLRGLTALLRQEIRRGDTLYRLGGEEFLVILRGSDEAFTESWIARFYERLTQTSVWQARDDTPMDRQIGRGMIGVSVGASVLQPDDDNWTQPLQRADEQLYAAKTEGRGRAALTWSAERILAPPVR